jgi:hypothetical protein
MDKIKHLRPEDYDGFCGELANEVLVCYDEVEDQAVLYVEARGGGLIFPNYDPSQIWKYHQVPVLGGSVFDLYSKGVKGWESPQKYCEDVFGGQDIEATLFRNDGSEEILDFSK